MARKRWVVVLIGCVVVPMALLLSSVILLGWPRPLYCPDRNLIKRDMSGDEVVAILGQPKEKNVRPDGETFWYYDCKGFISGSQIDVHFGKDGRVARVFILD